MDHDKELDAIVAKLSQIGPFDCRDPAEAVEAVRGSLEFWDSLLLQSPELISQLILKESGQKLVHGEIGKMVACLTRVAQEIVCTRLASHPE